MYNIEVMKTLLCLAISLFLLTASGLSDSHDWVDLWDGSTFDGWKITTENQSTFQIKDGMIIAQGPRAHLYYAGSVGNADFTDFELKIDVNAKNNSNGGIYFHTMYQETGWPDLGFEVQVNNTFNRDPRKTGSLYGVLDNLVPPAEDDTWFTQHIVVRGNNVKIYVDGHLITEWIQPEGWEGLKPLPNGRGMNFPGRKLSHGTIALQGHDPRSVVMYKNIRLRILE